MALTRRFTSPVQVVETSEMKARLSAIADREGVSFASVVRDCIRLAIDERERQSVSASA